MRLDDVSDLAQPNPQPFRAVPRPETDPAQDDQDIFLIPAPPPPAAWPRVLPGL